MNQELPDVKAGLWRGRGTRDQIANIHWIMEKARKFQRNIYFCFPEYIQAFDCVDHKKLWKIPKRQEYQATLPVSWETRMQVKKQQLEPNMEKWTGSKLGTEYGKENCHSAYVQYTSYRMPGWVGHKLEPRFLEETSTISGMQTMPL